MPGEEWAAKSGNIFSQRLKKITKVPLLSHSWRID
jgi:hypothetical protein